jgi:hypothetical protein
MSHETQNEIMAMNILRKVASNLQAADFYTIMMDETNAWIFLTKNR